MAPSNYNVYPTPMLFMRVPQPIVNFTAKFIYNFYTSDESTKENSDVPDIYKKKTIEKTDINLSTFSLRVPRYVELTWSVPKVGSNISPINHKPISENLDKVATEDSITKKYIPYAFSSISSLENAEKSVKNGAFSNSEQGTSQATAIDNFVNNLLKGYAESQETSSKISLRDQIKQAIVSIETLADRPENSLGYKFFDDNDAKVVNTGFSSAVSISPTIYSLFNTSVLPDVFSSSSLGEKTVSQLNDFYSKSYSFQYDFFVQPVTLQDTDDENFSSINYIGYIIDRYSQEANGNFKKDKTFVLENFSSNSLIDISVKYGTTYHYFLRPVIQVEIPGKLSNYSGLKKCTYYFASKPISTHVVCDEDVAPPPPTDINFVWDYKKNSLVVVWRMPFNSQRDIKQFQIFRRKSIYEPFELLKQHSFDFSSVKRNTGESIDGNNVNMTKLDMSYVEYLEQPSDNFVDKEFIVDAENLKSSTYIYTICSVDAHGYVSNYGSQFEVTFDFYKNSLKKKLISNAGAPRPYPNLLLNTDLFKDTISTSGLSSQKLKIYFMPEYFKLKYNSGKVQKMVTTMQEGGYYKIQFINTQNQKSDFLKINIDDLEDLAKV